ncbi:hypothetical protein CWO91_29165 [Bradyrhizobium genosp. SA-3]|uniref:hypothetical protein n=1 Tax=Bradyrhizobium genosp. SA-3 TaxID=508868 RepID=UPI001028A195|nr:hypothetical protein [Bradyrhizobium genosp. SA-3]RZN06473.1 hypothetical protein CWO91_29165 [Bradyrhizobium genosp. SA-3]
MKVHFVLVLALSFGILPVGFSVSLAQTAGERPQDVLAAQIRMQGFACDKPLGASKDRRRSRPDHAVWVLRCGNATYRVSRFPDMAAKVEALQ